MPPRQSPRRNLRSRRKSPMRKQRSRRKSPRRKLRSKKKSKSSRKSPKRKSKSRRKKSRMPTACILCNAANPTNCPLGCIDNTHQICKSCLALNINCPGCYDEAIAPPATDSGGSPVFESISGGPDQETFMLMSDEIIEISDDDDAADVPPTSSSIGEAISIGSGVGDINVQLYQTPGATMIDENGGGEPARSQFISSEPSVLFGPIFSGAF